MFLDIISSDWLDPKLSPDNWERRDMRNYRALYQGRCLFPDVRQIAHLINLRIKNADSSLIER